MFKMVIFDWKRTLYDPDQKKLISGALELLEFFKGKKIPMVLLGKGEDEMHREVERLKVRKYFIKVIFAPGEKDPKIYIPYISEKGPKKTLLIGDRVYSELGIGKHLGATTIWVRQGKFSMEEPKTEEQKPDYTVKNLKDCLGLLSRVLNS